MASHLLAAAIRIHHLNPVTAPPLRFVESPWIEPVPSGLLGLLGALDKALKRRS
jgi:hypothetical protein